MTREGTLDELFEAIRCLIDVGWRATSHEFIQVKSFSDTGRWQIRLGNMRHNGEDLSDAAAGLYQELREKAEAHAASNQEQADKWRRACDYFVPEWAWPKDWQIEGKAPNDRS